MTEEYRQLRIQFNTPSFKKRLREEHGCRCYNCGSSIDVQYHHIVPLAVGGTNSINNIVPLCYSCHSLVHGAKEAIKKRQLVNSGRKRKEAPDDYENILDDYLYGNIGTKECMSKLGMPKSAKLTEQWFYKEYFRENGIKSIKNRVDMWSTKKCRNTDHSNSWVSKIFYTNGTVKIVFTNGTEKIVESDLILKK